MDRKARGPRNRVTTRDNANCSALRTTRADPPRLHWLLAVRQAQPAVLTGVVESSSAAAGYSNAVSPGWLSWIPLRGEPYSLVSFTTTPMMRTRFRD